MKLRWGRVFDTPDLDNYSCHFLTARRVYYTLMRPNQAETGACRCLTLWAILANSLHSVVITMYSGHIGLKNSEKYFANFLFFANGQNEHYFFERLTIILFFYLNVNFFKTFRSKSNYSPEKKQFTYILIYIFQNRL